MTPSHLRLIRLGLPGILILIVVILGILKIPGTMTPSATIIPATATIEITPEARPTQPPAPSATVEPTAIPTVGPTAITYPVGPDTYPPGINPLSGLPVEDPESLKLPPALLSISNSPVNKEMVGLLHAVLIEQCRHLGSTPYPYALHRSHEIALVTFMDKAQIETLISREMISQGMTPSTPSNKQFAKNLQGRTRIR